MPSFLADFLDELYSVIVVEDRWKTYLSGLRMTLQIALIGLIGGIIIGVLVATVKVYSVGSRSKVLGFFNWLFNVYTTVVRGTPLMLQLLIIWGLSFMPNGEIACYIGFSLNSGAYLSEIFRGGINSIDPGQMEAGRSLGLSRNTTMRFVVLPQAIKNTTPALFNEFIALVKETSIAGYIAVGDLTKMVNNIKNRTYSGLPLYIAALIYLVLVFGLTLIQKQVERRYGKSDRN